METSAVDYSQYQGLGLSWVDGIMTVTIRNPAKKNAITPQMNLELVTIWEDVWRDPNVKVIILTGEGADFCSGIDLVAVDAGAVRDQAPSPVHPSTRRMRKHVMNIIECEKPVLAKVRGVAYGMGVSLALACDMVFASESARLCDPHVRAGMVAGDGGVLLWPLAVGMHRAKEYLMTGKPVPAQVAAEIGLINRCMPDDELDAYVQSTAETLRDLPSHAVNYTKVALNVVLKQLAAAAFESSVAYEIYTMETEDFKAATKAFAQKKRKD